jgi:hypothetical protein
MTNLTSRVRRLELFAEQSAGCRVCGGQLIIGIPADCQFPAWLSPSGRCRGCGNAIKLYPDEYLERLR